MDPDSFERFTNRQGLWTRVTSARSAVSRRGLDPAPEQGKPLERVGRKATGLRPELSGDRDTVAGLPGEQRPPRALSSLTARRRSYRVSLPVLPTLPGYAASRCWCPPLPSRRPGQPAEPHLDRQLE